MCWAQDEEDRRRRRRRGGREEEEEEEENGGEGGEKEQEQEEEEEEELSIYRLHQEAKLTTREISTPPCNSSFTSQNYCDKKRQVPMMPMPFCPYGWTHS